MDKLKSLQDELNGRTEAPGSDQRHRIFSEVQSLRFQITEAARLQKMTSDKLYEMHQESCIRARQLLEMSLQAHDVASHYLDATVPYPGIGRPKKDGE